MSIVLAVEDSFKNKNQIQEGTTCGCYHCFYIFNGKDIIHWVDGMETTCCPFCGVDSVLPGVTDLETLTAANKMWFNFKG